MSSSSSKIELLRSSPKAAADREGGSAAAGSMAAVDRNRGATGRWRRGLARAIGSRWALPIFLFVAFLAVFAAVMGDRLVPPLEVRAEPVVLVRSADGAGPSGESSRNDPAGEAAPDRPDADHPPAADPTAAVPLPPRGALLFQASGWVEPDPLPIKATALISGVVDDVLVLEGQTVERGQLLATLIDDDAALDLEEAERRIDLVRAQCDAHLAEIPVAEARVEVAERKEAVERARIAEQQDLVDRLGRVEKGTVPERQIREAEHELASRQAMADAAAAEIRKESAELEQLRTVERTFAEQIRQAEVEYERRKLAFDRTRIHSPVDGVVLRLLAVPGAKRMLDMDEADSSTVAILYQPGRLQVRVDVPLAEAGGLFVGQPVRITCDLLPDAEFDGVVTRIVGEADLQRNTLQAKVRVLDPDPRLRPEMLCRAKFFAVVAGDSSSPAGAGPVPGGGRAGAGRFVLFAPEAGLFDRRDRDRAVAWVVGTGGRAERRGVVVGDARRDGFIEVHEGLRPGDSVVLEPLERLEEGRRLRVMD